MIPALGEPFPANTPETKFQPVVITVQSHTRSLTKEQVEAMVWCLRYQALYHYNRSPWVERGYAAPVEDVVLVPSGETPDESAYHIELLSTSDEPGALGYHEGQEHKSSAHSTRGVAAATLQPLSKVFCKTSKEAGVAPSEVASHEMLEMLVDPWVNEDTTLRVYSNPKDGYDYIGEVGDPVQERGYDVGAPEGRSCKVAESIMADFAYPAWWAQAQRRPATAFCSDIEAWTLPVPAPNLAAFELGPGGYMSRRKPGGEWEQLYGEDRPKAEANAKGYEGGKGA